MPTKRWRCLFSLSIALLLVGLVVAAVAIPVLAEHAALSRSIEKSQTALLRYRRMIAQAPALEDEIERIESASDVASFYLSESSQALAAAELQDRAKNVVRSNGGELVSTQVLRSRDATNRVMIRVQMAGDTAALQRVVHAIESGQPFLFVDKLTVRASAQRRRGSRSGRSRRTGGRANSPASKTSSAAPIATRLTISLDLSGYIDTLDSDDEA